MVRRKRRGLKALFFVRIEVVTAIRPVFSVLIAAFSRILPEKNRRLVSTVRPFRAVWSGLQRR